MQTNQSKQLVKGAVLLTIAGIFSKMLSAAYRIPLQNLTGDYGFYIYQQVYPLIGMALILSLYGFPSAIAQIAVMYQGRQRRLSFTHIVLPLLIILFVMMAALAMIGWQYADSFARMIGDPKLAPTFQKLTFVFLLIPFTSVLRGIFQSQLQMQPIAYSQVSEQVIRVLVLLTAAILYSTGRLSSIYQIGEWAVYAALSAGAVALIVLLLSLRTSQTLSREAMPIPWGRFIYTLVLLGLVASLNHMILLLIQFGDSLTLVQALQGYGLNKQEAMVTKGVFDRGQPLIQLGTVIGSSFALTLIPEAAKQTDLSGKALTETLTFSLYIAIGATVGLFLIFPETNLLLFKDLKGSFSLQVLSLAVLLSTTAVTVIAILQGRGIIVRTALYIVLAFMIKVAGNLLLVPILNITGAALATILSLLCLTLLVLYELHKGFKLGKFWQELKWGALLKAAAAMGLYIGCLKLLVSPIGLQSRLLLLIYVLFVVITGSLLYLIVLIKHKALTDDQIAALPLSRLLIKISD